MKMISSVRFTKWLYLNPFFYQALAGEGGYGEPRDLPRAPLVNEPYYNTVQFGYPLDYGMARTYSGGYIGPGASNVSRATSFILCPQYCGKHFSVVTCTVWLHESLLVSEVQ